MPESYVKPKVRPAQSSDAARCVEYTQVLAAEPDIGIGLSEGEFIF